ncbi:MAG: AAA family ATPase [Armatimonadota bacterium]
MPKDQSQEIETLIRARYPIVYVVSWEEERVEACLRAVAQRRQKRLFQWAITTGLVEDGARGHDRQTTDPMNALEEVLASTDSAIFLLKDFHPFLKEHAVVRKLRDLTDALKRSYKTLVLLSPVLELPTELQKEITVVDYALPTIEEIGEQLDRVVQAAGDQPVDVKLTAEGREQIIKACQGLTAVEVDNVLSKSLVEKKCFDVGIILAEKKQIIRKSGVLEYFEAPERFRDIGGLDVLKGWLRKRAGAFSEKARSYGLPQPKGLLLLGVQGCGKSLTAKAVASLYMLPLLRLDVGRIFAGLIGSSEERMRRAIQTAESVAPAVLWLDEIDKGFAGTQSSTFSDAGTTSRVFASFVTWLQEKQSSVFVVATANDVTMLPPELLRKGRFDDIFFVDLPSVQERRDIFRIHLAKRNRDPDQFDLEALARQARLFSGAEIEQGIIAAMYDAFDQGRDITTEDVQEVISQSFPLSSTMREHIAALRDWSRSRARPASSAPEEPLLPDQENAGQERLPLEEAAAETEDE